MVACTAAEGRRPGRIRRRPARKPILEVLYPGPIPPRSGFYLHKLFRLAGVWILSTQTFRVAGVWILSTQTCRAFVGRKHYDSSEKLRKIRYKLKNVRRCARPSITKSIRKMNYTVNYTLKNVPRCARGLHHLIEKWGDDLQKISDFQAIELSLV